MSLFSAVVATLLSVTVPDLKQDPQDKSAFYLENIYKLQTLSGSYVSFPSTPAQPPPFSAPKYAIWVNVLLFMSLCLNILIVLTALWIRGFVPGYLWIIGNPSFSPQHRARINDILSSEFSDSPAVSSLVLMLYLSPLLFFLGLSIYLFNINRAVFGPVFSGTCLFFIVVCFATYWLAKVGAFVRVVFSFDQA